MIIGQITTIHGPAAILALMLVTKINILPGEADGVVPEADEMYKSDNSGQPDGKRD